MLSLYIKVDNSKSLILTANSAIPGSPVNFFRAGSPEAIKQPGYIARTVSCTPNFERAQTAQLHVEEQVQRLNQANLVFKGKAQELNELWYSFQSQEIFQNRGAISEQQINADLDLFYRACLSKIAENTRAFRLYVAPLMFESSSHSEEHIIQTFMQLNYQERAHIIDTVQSEYFARYARNDKHNITTEALSIMRRSPEGQAAVERILGYITANIGEENIWRSVPKRLSFGCRDKMNEKIKSFTKLAEQKGLKYIGKGDIGLVFSCEAFGQNAAFKVSIYPLDSQHGTSLAKQETQLEQLEPLIKDHPFRYSLPQLLKDQNGEKVGLPGRVMAMKFFDGDPLTHIGVIETNSLPLTVGLINNDYKNSNINEQFAVDFMDFYLIAARNGIDLHDIRPGNFLYKAAHFQIVELGGLDNSDTNFLIKLRKEYPEAFLIYTLMEDIFMFGTNSPNTLLPREMALLQDPELNQTNCAEPALKLAGHSFAKMLSSLELAVKQGVISPREIVKGVQDLKGLYKQDIRYMYPSKFDKTYQTTHVPLDQADNGFHDNKYQHSDYEYLDYMEKHFKQQIGLKKFIGNTKRKLRNAALAWVYRFR